ncbi:hypothetical protein BU23DRAFT_511504 [Bimuria novae-zelandiae CBS 107.79]|uniref:3CxxC-type domain-containing protein n=1 Tax=Bimuria novae-zelandiae CBS 107.79 TaxID=1447943 RepID=A0A6A5V0L8_9PLEO|nr:hypothetical protein BU23DRAFT_511504 [Bimuria novae-zelandiae CBS 107.79]
MAKKKSNKNSNGRAEVSVQLRSSFLYPQLHEDVLEAVAPFIGTITFHHTPTTHDAVNVYRTNVMGKFTCTDKNCRAKGWGSKKVSIVITKYYGNEYNAVVYGQRCKECNHLGDLHLDKDSYIERVAYRLKKWGGVEMDKPYYTRKQGLPHKRDLCEGCKRGLCSEEGG